MNKRTLTHLVCPVDGEELEALIWESADIELSSDEKQKAERLGIEISELTSEWITGVLVNRRKNLLYPIHNGVPRMLCFQTGVHKAFLRAHGKRLQSELPNFSFPHQEPVEGEREVLRTFSTEWTDYDWDDDAYWNLDKSEWFKCMDYVLGFDKSPAKGELVAEIGMGIGGVANHVSQGQDCEVVGVDLGYAVDPAQQHFGSKNPFMHVVQASAYALPFREKSFDRIYSFGVLHHTYSTIDGVRSVAKYPKDGGRLFVWVYSPWDESRTWIRRRMMKLESVLRPRIAPLSDPFQTAALAPLIPLYMGHQALRALKRGRGEKFYGVREALHAARDRFTPRYIHRHSPEEVSTWFQELGYSELDSISDWPRPDFIPEAFQASTGIHGRRQAPISSQN